MHMTGRVDGMAKDFCGEGCRSVFDNEEGFVRHLFSMMITSYVDVAKRFQIWNLPGP